MKKLWLNTVVLSILLCAVATAEAGISVGFLHSDVTVPGNPDVVALLSAPGFVDELTSINVQVATPSLGDLEDFDVIVLHINNTPFSVTTLGDVLADYVDTGRRLVMGVGAAVTGFAPAGRLLFDAYKPLQDVAAPLYVLGNIGTLVGHEITSGIVDLEESVRTDSVLSADAESIGTFDDGNYLGAVKGNVVEINFFFQDWADMPYQECELLLNAMYGIGDWEPRAALPVGRYMAMSASDGTYTYVFGGDNGAGTMLNTAYRYDPVANTWTAIANMPTGIGYGGAIHVAGKIYIPGGYTAGGYDCQVYIYDIAGNTWSTDTDACAVPSSGYSIAYWGGYIYHLGGYALGFVADVARYDIAAGTWQTRTPMTVTRWGAASAGLGRKIYVAGGKSDFSTPTKVCEVYDIAADTWSDANCADMPGIRTAAGYVAWNGLLFMVGGGSADTPNPGDPMFDNAMVYDPVFDVWYPSSNQMNEPYWGGAAAAVDGNLYVAGSHPDETSHEATGVCTYEYGDFGVECGTELTDNNGSYGNYYEGYSCVSWTETGPEVRVRLALSWAKYVTASLTGMSGDLDVFLLDSCDPSTCVTFGDHTAEGWLEPGDNYIVVDGFAGAVSPFTLSIDCCDCVISTACYQDGDTNPANPCEVCDRLVSQDAWSPNDGATCDDGVFCNGVDVCDGTVCEHPGDPCPDDGQWCNGEEACDEANDECDANNVPDCSDDGTFCNGAESCDETTDQCISAGDPCADDGLWCNGEEICDETGDACDVENVPDCSDDGTFCNGTESCDETNDECVSSGDPCDPITETCNEDEDTCDAVDDDDNDDETPDDDDDADDDATDDDDDAGGGGGGDDDDSGGCGC